MQRLIPVLIIIALAAVIFIVEQYKPAAKTGLNPVFQVLGEAQRQVERAPLALTRVSDAEETRIGRELASRYGLARSGHSGKLKTEQYLAEVGNRLVPHIRRKGIRYRFYLVEGTNAFALPGGHVAVGRGLLSLMGSEDELAAVLGHEIAHIDRRHCIERLQYKLAAKKMGLDIAYILASIPIALFQAGYSKNLELEADRAGTSLAAAASYSPFGAIDLFKRMQTTFEPRRPGKSSPAEEIKDVITDFPVAYFRSHPPFHVRLSALQREIQIQGWKNRAPKPLRMPL